MRKWSSWLLGMVLLVAAVAASIVGYLAAASLPRYSGNIELPGIVEPVAISRDEHGIPEIVASNIEDLYFGIGFAHAQDRLWQMEFARRVGSGRLSEVLGKQTVRIDRYMRTLGFARVAQRNWHSLPDIAKQGLEAYARGVNAFLSDPGGSLPPEFHLLRTSPEPWRPTDSLLMTKLLALDLSKNWRDEATRFQLAEQLSGQQLQTLWPESGSVALEIPKRTSQFTLLYPPEHEGLGSNIWAVTGPASATGQALLANDPHLGLRTPGTWYWVRLRAPGVRAVVATIPALPTAIIGRNQDIAWGFTNSGADIQDLFVETLDPTDPSRYLTKDGPLEFDVRHEVINVRDEAPLTIFTRATNHGPVISDIDGAKNVNQDSVLSLQWTALDDVDRTLAAGFELLLAENWPDFKSAIEKFDSPPQNAFYTDRVGQIGQLLAGRIPIRNRGDGRFPQDGSSGEFDWTGELPFDEKPQVFDPQAGILANANNRIVDDDYPHHLTADWDPPLRYRRLTANLRSKPHEKASMIELQNDRYSQLAEETLWLLEADRDRNPLAEALLSWDRIMHPDRPEPLLFQTWYRALQKLVLADELGDQFSRFRGMRTSTMLHIFRNAQYWCDDQITGSIESCEVLASIALEEAAKEIEARTGTSWPNWRWGEASRVRIEHQPLTQVPLLNRLFDIKTEKGGGPTSLDVARFASNDPFATIAGPSMRFVVDWSEPDASYLVSATGQSGHPLSPHYRDMTKLWADGELLRIVLPTTQPQGNCVLGDMNCLQLTPKGAQFESGG